MSLVTYASHLLSNCFSCFGERDRPVRSIQPAVSRAHVAALSVITCCNKDESVRSYQSPRPRMEPETPILEQIPPLERQKTDIVFDRVKSFRGSA